MAALKLHRFGSWDDTEEFLRGDIAGGTLMREPVYGIHGTTLIFTVPAVTVTFATPGASAQEALSPHAIIDQIATALGAGYQVQFIRHCVVVRAAVQEQGLFWGLRAPGIYWWALLQGEWPA